MEAGASPETRVCDLGTQEEGISGQADQRCASPGECVPLGRASRSRFETSNIHSSDVWSGVLRLRAAMGFDWLSLGGLIHC